MDREINEPSLDEHEAEHSVADAIREAMGDSPVSIEEEEMLEAAEMMDIDHHHL